MDERPVPRRSVGRSHPRRRMSPLPLIVTTIVLGLTLGCTATHARAVVWTSNWHDAHFVGQTQEHAQWCAPASGSISLSSIGVHVGQAQLARESGTTLAGGTPDSARYVAALDRAAAHVGVTYSLTSEPSAQLMGQLLASEIEHGYAPPMPVVAGRLPWVHNGSTEGHVIVIVGADPTDHDVRVWDPDAGAQHVHVMTWSQLYRASQGPGLTYVMTGA